MLEWLKQGHMTVVAKVAFFSTVAATTFQFKHYTSHDEKVSEVSVAKQIDSKYLPWVLLDLEQLMLVAYTPAIHWFNAR